MRAISIMLTLCGFLSQVAFAQGAQKQVRVNVDVWADNWFSFFLGEKQVMQDSVPITTERSFNSERFLFEGSYPLTLNFIVKDFIENDTGLEYIGTRRQQLGDGGFIAQFTDAETGRMIAVTDGSWNCLVVHKAPIKDSCANEVDPRPGIGSCSFEKLDEPAGWKSPSFDSSHWPHAKVFTAGEVGPKGGYHSIPWHPSAKFIWSSDLKKDNIVLCRLTVRAIQ